MQNFLRKKCKNCHLCKFSRENPSKISFLLIDFRPFNRIRPNNPNLVGDFFHTDVKTYFLPLFLRGTQPFSIYFYDSKADPHLHRLNQTCSVYSGDFFTGLLMFINRLAYF